MNTFIFILLFLVAYILILGFFPRVLLIFTSKLLIYHRGESIRQRFEKLLPVYLFFMLIVGSLFSPLFGVVRDRLKEIFFNLSPFFLATIFSFFFVWSIRVMTLTNKTNILCLCPIYKERIKELFKKLNNNYDWKKQKKYLASFLFSLIFTILLISITQFFINTVYDYTLNTVWEYRTSVTGGTIWTYFFILISIFITMGILIVVGEILIKQSKVHDECYTEIKY